MKYKHFVITRFNNNIYKRPDSQRWMDKRMFIFKKYLLPSIMSQTSKNFSWVMTFDKKTPDNILRYFEELGVIIIFTRAKEWIPPKEAEWIVTSRIDNDDAYFPTFIEEIQRELVPQRRLIDVEYCIYDHINKKLYDYERPSPNSPFITVVEKWDDAKGVYAHEHSFMPNKFSSYRIPGKILACQVIHGDNVLNKVRGVKSKYDLYANTEGIWLKKVRH